MKILYITHMFLPVHSAGTEVLTYQVARTMQRRGHEVQVVTCESWSSGLLNPWGTTDSYDGLPVHRIHLDLRMTPNPMLAQYYLPLVEEYLRNLYRSCKPDLIHIHHFLFLSTAAATAAHKEGIPVIFTPTDFWLICPTCQLLRYDNSLCNGPTNLAKCAKCVALGFARGQHFSKFLHRTPEWLFNWGVRHVISRLRPYSRLAAGVQALAERANWNRQLAQTFARVLVPTRFMRDRFVENGVSAERMILLPYGLDVSWSSSIPQRQFQIPLRIGFIGTIHPHKGLHVLLEAFLLLRPVRHAQLLVYGDLNFNPGYTAALRARVNSHPCIHFRGTFPAEKIGEVLNELDLLVIPSIWYENSPLVLHAALAARLPVVCSDMGGLVEVIRDGENGFVFRSGDYKHLAEKLQFCLDEPPRLSEISKAIQPIKDIETYANELEEIYRDCREFPTE